MIWKILNFLVLCIAYVTFLGMLVTTGQIFFLIRNSLIQTQNDVHAMTKNMGSLILYLGSMKGIADE